MNQIFAILLVPFIASCGQSTSTIGFEKRNSKARVIDNEDEFVRIMVADIPAPSTGAAAIRAANSEHEVTAA